MWVRKGDDRPMPTRPIPAPDPARVAPPLPPATRPGQTGSRRVHRRRGLLGRPIRDAPMPTPDTLPPRPPVPYEPACEPPRPDEREAIEALKDVFARMAATVAGHEGHAFRAVHAKGHALLDARLVVDPGLPAELAHGLFARPACYRAI